MQTSPQKILLLFVLYRELRACDSLRGRGGKADRAVRGDCAAGIGRSRAAAAPQRVYSVSTSIRHRSGSWIRCRESERR